MNDSRHNLAVSPETAAFIAALHAFNQAKEAYYDALERLYGPDQADQMMNDNAEAFEPFERLLSSGLTASVLEKLSAYTGELAPGARI